MPAKGDLVLVRWVDIESTTNGDPADADLAVWESVGWIHGWRRRKGVSVLVLALTRDLDGGFGDQTGYISIPSSCVRRITPLRRGRSTGSPAPASGPSSASDGAGCE